MRDFQHIEAGTAVELRPVTHGEAIETSRQQQAAMAKLGHVAVFMPYAGGEPARQDTPTQVQARQEGRRWELPA